VHPQPEQESIFMTVFAGWLRFGGIFRLFRWSLRATTKIVHPRQNPGYANEAINFDVE